MRGADEIERTVTTDDPHIRGADLALSRRRWDDPHVRGADIVCWALNAVSMG
jgi:hypothetical protein